MGRALQFSLVLFHRKEFYERIERKTSICNICPNSSLMGYRNTKFLAEESQHWTMIVTRGRLFRRACSNRTGDNGFKLKEGRFRLATRKKFFR